MEFEWSDIFKENLVRYTINIYELLHSLLSGTVTSEKTEPIRSRRMCRSFAKLETCTSCQTLRPSRRGDLDQGGSRWPTGGAFCIFEEEHSWKKGGFSCKIKTISTHQIFWSHGAATLQLLLFDSYLGLQHWVVLDSHWHHPIFIRGRCGGRLRKPLGAECSSATPSGIAPEKGVSW